MTSCLFGDYLVVFGPKANNLGLFAFTHFKSLSNKVKHGRVIIMATFSPSPAPRRSSRLRQKATSPVRKSARLATAQKTVARLSPPGLNDRLQPTLMDVDETESIATERSTTRVYGETIYAKSDELTVSFYASLPVEVKQVLRSAGMIPLYRNRCDPI